VDTELFGAPGKVKNGGAFDQAANRHRAGPQTFSSNPALLDQGHLCAQAIGCASSGKTRGAGSNHSYIKIVHCLTEKRSLTQMNETHDEG
jgi:hypothetical protein